MRSYWITVCACILFVQSFQACLIAQDKTTVISVVDSNGNPIDDATGWFYDFKKSTPLDVLNGKVELLSTKGVLVVRKSGFQTNGLVLDGKSKQLKLLSNSESSRKLKTRPYPLDDESRKRLVKDIEAYYWDRLENNPRDFIAVSQCLKVLGRLKPEKCETFVANLQAPAQQMQMIQSALLETFAETDIEAALEFSETFEDPTMRSMAIGRVLTKASVDDPRLPELERQFIITIKSVKQPAYRLACWAILAEHYLVTGRTELSKKIIEQHIDEVKKLPSGGWSGYPRSLFAAFIVNDDADTAEKMLDGLDANEKNRAYGRLAFHCCQSDPDKATELLDRTVAVKNAIVGAGKRVKVCAKMAEKHPEKSIALAKTIQEPNQKSWALGLVAKQIAKSRPDLAKKTLNLAIETLTTADKSTSGTGLSFGSTLGGL